MPVPEKPEGVTEGQWTDYLPHLKQLAWEALWDNAMEHANDGESKLNTPPQSHAVGALRTSRGAVSCLLVHVLLHEQASRSGWAVRKPL